jgi:uncharacterized membrane protein YgaE (UPF0421/DUF939 family)
VALNIIARGIIFNFIFNLVIVFILIHYQFELNNNTFTILLLINLILMSIHTGVSSKKNQSNAEINGVFVGLGSACIIFLFISQFAILNWEVNALILTIWMFFGYIGGFLGAKMIKSK